MIEEKVEVRTGTPEDIYLMMDLALAACEENGLSRPNPQKLAAEIWSSLNLHYGIIGIIGDYGKPLEAAVLLRVENQWYSDDLVMNERAVFVAEPFRQAKGGRASKLLDFATTAASTLGLPLMIGILSNQRTEGKVRTYERKLGAAAGAYWIVNGHTGNGPVEAGA